jgi:anti-anti-sigma factor
VLSLTVSNDIQNERTYIRIQGVLDISTIDTFKEQTLQTYEQLGSHGTLVVDYSGLEFIDSTGIGAILEIIYASKEYGFSVSFEGISEEIAEIFETIGVMRVLEAIIGNDA